MTEENKHVEKCAGCGAEVETDPRLRAYMSAVAEVAADKVSEFADAARDFTKAAEGYDPGPMLFGGVLGTRAGFMLILPESDMDQAKELICEAARVIALQRLGELVLKRMDGDPTADVVKPDAPAPKAH